MGVPQSSMEDEVMKKSWSHMIPVRHSPPPRPTDGSGHVNEGLANQWDSSSRERH